MEPIVKDPITTVPTHTRPPAREPAISGCGAERSVHPHSQNSNFPKLLISICRQRAVHLTAWRFVTMKSNNPGHAKRLLDDGVYGRFCVQFYCTTKFGYRDDDDIKPAKLGDVIWAMTTRMDPARRYHDGRNTPSTIWTSASPVSGLARKWGYGCQLISGPGETDREWGEPIAMTSEVKQRRGRMVG